MNTPEREIRTRQEFKCGRVAMPRSIVMVCAVLLAVALLIVTAHSQEDMQVVDNEAFENPRRPASVFAHDEHNEKAGIDDCAECHHVYEDGRKLEDESSEDQSCGECHALEDQDRTPGLRKAFHLNCIGCHEQRRQGPIACGECHVR